MVNNNNKKKYKSITPILTRPSKFCWPMFEPGQDLITDLHENSKVLVVGAGGLGCEILKDLALSGFGNIEVVDLDSIDLSNLNRQFLFRKKDVGKAKAEIAAKFIEKRCPGVKVKWYCKKIQEFPLSFYKSFHVIIAGLDNVGARRYLNRCVAKLVEYDEDGDVIPDSVVPFIDGGTEGFKGQARVFLPMLTSCFECSVKNIPDGPKIDICTAASVPRSPEHCIQYALWNLWPLLTKFKTPNDYEMRDEKSQAGNEKVELDCDNRGHMTWLFKKSCERAKEYNITGVTYVLTMQVAKNIIPAIASSNALIAAECVNEAFKLVTYSSMVLNNYLMYMGQTGVYTRTFEYQKDPECIVCSNKPQNIEISGEILVEDLIAYLQKNEKFKLKKPSITCGKTVLYMFGALSKHYKENLTKSLKELIKDGDSLNIVDGQGVGEFEATIKFNKDIVFTKPVVEENN